MGQQNPFVGTALAANISLLTIVEQVPFCYGLYTHA